MKIKIGIFGSSVTRDVFCSKLNDYKEFFDISFSLERVSLISLMDDRNSIEFNEEDIQINPLNKTNKFRSEILKYDLSKNYFTNINEKVDYIIIDVFFDVFFGVIKINDNYITNNFWDYPNTKFYETINKNNKLTFNHNFMEYYLLWRNSCDKFFRQVYEKFPNVKIILNKVKLTSRVLKADGSYYIDEELQRNAEIYNPLIKLLESYLEKYHNVLIVDCTEFVVVNDNNLQNKGIIYFSDEFYIKVYEKILEVINENKFTLQIHKNHDLNHGSSNSNSYLKNSDDLEIEALDSNLNEFLEIKKYLFEESSINHNFIDIDRLNDYFNYISKNNYKNVNLNIQESSFNELIKINQFIAKNKESLEKDTKNIENEINSTYFNENAEYLIKYLESRIDIKNYGTEMNNIIILKSNDSSLNITQPSWFTDVKGIGSVVRSIKGDLSLLFKCVGDGKLSIEFKSVDYRDKYGNRIPIYIDYSEIVINNEIVVDGSEVLWHDSPFIFEKEVNDGDMININVKWNPINYKSNLFLQTDYEKLIDNFYTARIDIKNRGKYDNDLTLIDCDDHLSDIYKPNWFIDNEGIGTIVTSSKCNIDMSFKCINEGNLKIDFRGIDFSDLENNRIPIYIDYKEIEIDGEPIINGSTVLCHDKPLSYEKEVENGQIVNIKVIWDSLNKFSNFQNILSNSKNKDEKINKLKKEIYELNNENEELNNKKNFFISNF